MNYFLVFSILIAQQTVPSVTPENMLWVYGPLYGIVGWFMLRNEKTISKLSWLGHKIEGMTRAMLVDVLSRENAGSRAREEARKQLDEIEEKTRVR